MISNFMGRKNPVHIDDLQATVLHCPGDQSAMPVMALRVIVTSLPVEL